MDTDSEARQGADETSRPVLDSEAIAADAAAKGGDLEPVEAKESDGPIVASYQLRVTQRAHLTEAVEGGAEAKGYEVLTNEAIAAVVREVLEGVTGCAITVRAERLDQ